MIIQVIKKRFEGLIIFSLICIGLIALMLTRDFIYFRDYALIYDGAERISQGQTPYEDFGLPVGPITFLISAIFLKVTNYSWTSLYKAQLFLNIVTLAFIFGTYSKLDIPKKIIYLSLLGVAIFYLVFQVHPWYNTTAVMLVFINQYLILSENKYSILFVGASAALAVFTKQDIGILIFVASFFELMIIKKESGILLTTKFFLGFITVLLILANYYKFENLTYWMNFGQHGDTRNPLQNQPSVLSLISIASVAYGALKREKLYLICGVIVGIASISANTSGLYFTHFYFVAGLIPIIFSPTSTNRLYSLTRFCVFLFTIRTILHCDYFLLENFIKGSPEHYLFGSKFITKDLKVMDLGNCDRRLNNILGTQDTCSLIVDTKGLIEKKILPVNGTILNLSELRIINSLIGYNTPKGHPLWYDEKIALYQREEDLIKKQIINGAFDIILFQTKDLSDENLGLLNDFFHSSIRARYNLRTYVSPSDLTDCTFVAQCPRNIWFFYKIN